MAVENVFGGELQWYSEIEPAACKVLASHTSSDVPNLGDIKKIDWSTVEPIDILTGGYPCQPFSAAGLRKGTEDERHLWPYVREAIRHLRPKLVVLENVRGHLTLGFDTVLGEMATVGYDARWGIVRASDAGACHQRARLFILAYPNSSQIGSGHGGLAGLVEEVGANAANQRVGQDVPSRVGGVNHVDEIGSDTDASDTDRSGLEGHIGDTSEAQTWRQGHNQQGVGAPSSNTESNEQRESAELGPVRSESGDGADAGSVRLEWGKYEPAIRRWETITRSAPTPTILGNNGKPKLNPVFVEWMMGLPEGHVTGHGLRHAQELKMLGNGVVPQQAELAIRTLLNVRG